MGRGGWTYMIATSSSFSMVDSTLNGSFHLYSANALFSRTRRNGVSARRRTSAGGGGLTGGSGAGRRLDGLDGREVALCGSDGGLGAGKGRDGEHAGVVGGKREDLGLQNEVSCLAPTIQPK